MKRNNIVITGGLGYIGTELCKLYSGEAWYKNITVVDSRFVSERVKQLRDWGINFKQGSILDEDFMCEVLQDADLVYHFAGITDVAYTKAEENKQSDMITKVGVEGSRIVMNCISKDCKLLFPSTHVVYEGFDETRHNVTEEEPTCAQLTYATGKVQTEVDLKNSEKNYIVLRLASVYGYSTDTMRMGIMPNLFSKIASQDGTIKLFSGGIQLKSLVPLLDVARCFKFMGEKEDISREIFHLSKDNMTVREVAELCKEINPKLNLIETKDEIPNLGYTISNKKLLSTGFEFRYDLKESLNEMIFNWSKRESRKELEYTIQGGKEYVDERGKISNYELTEPINLIGYIESKKGTVRANHYHPIQEQKCLLIKGKYISVIKDLTKPNSPIETKLIHSGDIAIIKPNVAHTMVFLEDSIFLNLVRGEREHENYGITHTIPYVLVDDVMRDNLLKNYRTSCRCCGNEKLEKIISFGLSPLANNLLDDKNQEDELYPLQMNFCSRCYNSQLSYSVEPEKMFKNYLYVSSTAKTFRNHFNSAAKKYKDRFNLNRDSLVVDIGSNDGIFIKPIIDLGINGLGVEPAENISKIANSNGVPTINEFFNNNTVNTILESHGKADIITASNVFAHADNLVSIAKNVFKLLKDEGSFIIEVQYLLDTINDLTFDNIYHEHYNYWCVLSLYNFFKELSLEINDVEHIDTHGGSIRVYVSREGKNKVLPSVDKFIKKEVLLGMDTIEYYQSFAKKVEDCKSTAIKNINEIKKSGKKIVGYGSPAKATTVLNYYGLTSKDIDYIVEDNELKHNRLLPGVRIPITNKERLVHKPSDVILVLAWNFFDVIKENNKSLVGSNSEFTTLKKLEKQ